MNFLLEIGIQVRGKFPQGHFLQSLKDASLWNEVSIVVLKTEIRYARFMKTGNSETAQALTEWRDGNRKRLEGLVEANLPWIEGKIRYRLTPFLRKKGDTCDYMQDALAQFFRYAPRFVISDENDFKAILLTIAKNVLHNAYDWYSAKRRNVALERPLPQDTVLNLDPPRGRDRTPSSAAGQHEREAWVRFGMEFLDHEDREVLVLRQWDKKSFEEIGQHFQISSKAAWMKHRRAIDRLSRAIFNLRSGKLSRLTREAAS